MNRLIIIPSKHNSKLKNKVLCNTYFLLSLTIAFSAFIAYVSNLLSLPPLGIVFTIIGFYTLLFLTNYLSNSLYGIISTFALTGFMGYTLSPLLSTLISSGSENIVILSLASTSLMFFICSIYIIITNKDMSFISNLLLAGFIVLVMLVITNTFINMPALNLTISIICILFSFGTMISEISNITNNGETNYVRATVSLYVSLYNIIVNILGVFIGIRKNY